MHRLLRNTHLFLGLFSCAYLLMYGISAAQMGHRSWFKLQPTVTESRMTVPAEIVSNPRLVALELMNRNGLRGELRDLNVRDGGYSFSIVRPGTIHDVQHKEPGVEMVVRTNTAGFMAMLNRIHHAAGLWHEYWVINMWGVFVAVVSVALILLALSGIYLWFKIHAERRVGATLLTLSLGYSLTLMVLMRMA